MGTVWPRCIDRSTGRSIFPRTYRSQTKTLAWQAMKNDRMFDFIKLYGASSDASFYAYCRIESPIRQQMMLLPGSDDGLKIWHNGQVVWTHTGVRAALPLQDLVYLDLQPGSNDLLFRVNNVEGDCASTFTIERFVP